MGYILLFCAVLCGSIKGYSGKVTSGALVTLPHKLYFAAIRTALCAIISLLIVVFTDGFPDVSAASVIISVISGISMSVFLLSWIAAVCYGGYVRLDVCCQTGMVIPCVFAAPILGESVSVVQYIALGFLLLSIVLLSDRGKKEQSKLSVREGMLLIVVWLSSGINSLTLKLHSNIGEGSGTFYNFVTFVVAAVAFSVVYGVFRVKNGKVTLPKNHYTVYLPVMAVCLYLNTFLQTVAAKYLDAMIMFPLVTVLGLLFSAIMAAVFFKEKPTVKNIIGIIVAGAAIIAMQ